VVDLELTYNVAVSTEQVLYQTSEGALV